MGRPRTVAPPSPRRGTAADDGSAGTPTRHSFGTNGSRPEHGALARRKYGLLVPTETAVESADAGDPGSADGHRATGEQ